MCSTDRMPPVTGSLAPHGEDQRFRVWALLALAGLCHVCMMFEAWGWPAIDGYPTIERFLDPSFLRNDFYTNTSRGYGVDTAQAYLFGTLQQWTGVHYDVQLAALNVLRCLTFPALVYAFFLALSGRRTLAISGVLIGVLSNFALPRTLGWAWVWGDPSTAMFAVPAIVLAWTLLLRRRAGAAFGWLAFAAAMHPLAALHGAIVMGTILLLDYSRDETVALLKSPTALAGGALFFVTFASQYVLLKADPRDQLPIAEYVNIMAYERHPGDFLPSRFSQASVVSFALAALCVAFVLWRAGAAIPKRRLVVGTLLLYVAICVLGGLFVEVVPLRFFVQLIPFRTANIGAPFMLFVLAWFAAKLLEEERYLTYAAVLALSVLATQYVAKMAGHRGVLLGQLAPLALLGIVVANLTGRGPLPAALEKLGAPLFAGTRLTAVVGTGLCVLGLVAASARRDALVLPRAENQHPVYAWMQTHTPVESTFLVDQYTSDKRYGGAINPQKVRLVGRRPVVASLDFPFLDRDMRPWLERWKVALEGRTPDRVDRADVPALETLRRRFPFDYVLRKTPLPATPGATLEAEFPPWQNGPKVLVYRLAS